MIGQVFLGMSRQLHQVSHGTVPGIVRDTRLLHEPTRDSTVHVIPAE